MVFFGVFVFLLAGVSAIDEGDTLTQTQLDNYDIEGMTYSQMITVLKCRWEDNQTIQFIELPRGWFFYRHASCLNIKPIGASGELYRVYRHDKYMGYSVEEFVECVEEDGAEECIGFYQGRFIEEARMFLDWIKETTMSFQTPPLPDPSILELFGGDLWG